MFYQFFTRYVMNDSAAWTEEIARYLLICMVFIGAAIGVRKNNHIQVDFFYRLMPAPVGRGLSTLSMSLRIAFFALRGRGSRSQMMQQIGSQRMTIVDLPMNLVYGVVLARLRADDMALGRVARATGGAATACSSGPN